jgi:transcriptional regulator with XRE-family HTH domain
MDGRYYDPRRVKELRRAKGLTQVQVAQILRVHKSTIKRMESGQTSITLLAKLAKILDVPVTELVRSNPKVSFERATIS